MRSLLERHLNDQMAAHHVLFRAIALANHVHHDHSNAIGKGRYIVHPMHGVVLLSQCGFAVERERDLEVMVAHVLHDTKENRPELITFEEIEAQFGARVRRYVEVVTLDPLNPDKVGDREKLLSMSWHEQSVKMPDVASNSFRFGRALETEPAKTLDLFPLEGLAQKVEMERSFVTRCLDSGSSGPNHAIALRHLTLSAIDYLEGALKPFLAA
jgi:hypothetical protein